MRLDTRAVHAAADIDRETRAVAPPIHLSTTFEHGPEFVPGSGYLYQRYTNPTQDRLEQALAALDGGAAALAFASGMAAGTCVLQALPAGSHVLMADDTYFAFRRLAELQFAQWQLQWSVVDMANLPEVRAALRPNTALLWTETPSNPLIKISDVAALAAIAHEHGARLLVDATFATPVLLQPIALGADVVLHSTTKYFGGHSDVLGGALVLSAAEAARNQSRLSELRKLTGATPSPFNSWLVLRGIRSLPCRVRQQSASARALADFLHAHPAVERVHYPGLPTHPNHAVALQQMALPGGMLSVQIAGGRDAALQVAGALRYFVNATSLGGVESLVEHRASVEGPGSPTPDNLLRLSVGLEDAEDLVEDFRQALAIR
ncbi:MAG: aminotransferase class I/II-fold pyridoxal phosphate-dependent enzyme [Xanthomonadales bacterium]|jgi:cystathionine gamma-synthase|nr:aminotransferase class I/II-fold pyridoxal phosphate-dependent enzyme [Xanthomonadales bacterium]